MNEQHERHHESQYNYQLIELTDPKQIEAAYNSYPDMHIVNHYTRSETVFVFLKRTLIDETKSDGAAASLG